ILTEMKKWLLIALALGAAAGLICWLLRPSSKAPEPVANELSAPAQRDRSMVDPITNWSIAPIPSPEQPSSTFSAHSTPNDSLPKNATAAAPPPQVSTRLADDDHERKEALRAAFAAADKAAEERRRKGSTNEIALPNFEPRAGHPKPLGLNFYEMNDYYP